MPFAKIGTLDFWKLALKPGKPVAVGEVAGTPFVGLPGNPVSALVTFWLIVRPLLMRLMGIDDLSAPELTERIALLRSEIGRLEKAIEARQATRAVANSVFKI